MPIGVKRIILKNPNDNNIINQTGQEYQPAIVIKGDRTIVIKADYHAATPENERGRAKWIIKPYNNNVFYTKEDKSENIGDEMDITIPAKLCGSFTLSVEAFLNNPENDYPTRVLVVGVAPEKIVKVTWSKKREGSDIGSEKIKYGDDIWLNIQTEGLNYMNVEVDVYTDDHEGKFYTKNNVKVKNGEININFRNTFSWRASTGWNTKDSGEKFWVKVRSHNGEGKNIPNDGADKKLIIKDVTSSKEINESTSSLPLKVGDLEKNLERHEPCRFTALSIIDEGKTIHLFDEGTLKLKNEEKKEFQISEKIHFDLDKAKIRPDAKIVLNGIAKFLNDNPFVPVELGAHCDIRGDHKYNDKLSKQRASAGLRYLVSKGIGIDRISSRGYGKRRLIHKGENIPEKLHEQNRRLTIRFKIFGGDAQSIVYATIAPDEDTKKEISLVIKDFNTDKCFQQGTASEHDTNVKVIELTQNGKNDSFKYDGKEDIKHKVFSNLSGNWYKLMPLNYILPHKIEPNQFLFHPHSCRYYSDKTKASVIVNVYSDIKWEFILFLNLSNALSVKWQNLNSKKHKELQKIAGKIGAEKRWKQIETNFGVSLDAKWNKKSKDEYSRNEELTITFEAKIKRLYKIFGQLKEASKIITSGTKSSIAKTKIGGKLPLSIEMKPPNFALGAEWQLARGVKNKKPIKELGTELKLYFKADPLIGLGLTLDLLGLAIGLTGPAAPVLNTVRSWMGEGENISLDIYINLVVTGTIQIPDLSLSYNTASDKTDPNRKINLEADATIELKLEAGLLIKAKVVIVVAEFYASAKAHVEGKGSITFGHKITYQSDKLIYRPKLQFDGIHAKVEVKAEVGMTIRKGWFSGDYTKELDDFKDEFKTRPFDIIKKIEELTGLSADITLIE